MSSLADSGNGSLRSAIAAASDGDTILLRAAGELYLQSPLQVGNNITILGETGPLGHILIADGQPVFQIMADANVTLSRLSLRSGRTTGNGGAVSSEGNLVLDNLRIMDSHATGLGGAVYQGSGSLGVVFCHFEGNTSGNAGGAIAVAGGSLIVRSSAFVANAAGTTGGGIYVDSPTAEIRNTTLTMNQALSSGGGAFFNSGIHTLVNLTLVDNQAATGAHIGTGTGAVVEIGNSVLDGVDGFAGFGGAASLVSLGHNLSSGPRAAWMIESDLADIATGLGKLGPYGGLGPSYPLLPGSPAIDSGDDAIASGADQRGLARFSDGDGENSGATVDRGAFEVQMYRVSALQIRGSATGGADDEGYGNPFDPSDDADSIASADVFAKLTQTGKADIGDAVGANNAAGGGAVAFTDRIVPGRIVLKGSELEVRRDIAIYGPGAPLMAIDGDARSPVMRVGEGAFAYIEGIAIENGSAEMGAGIVVEADSTLELQAVSVRSNRARLAGGGVAVLSGEGTIFRSSLLHNTAAYEGGALFSAPGTSLTVDTSTLASNSAGIRGGAVAGGGNLIVDSAALVGNHAGTTADDIFISSGGAARVSNSLFAQTDADSINLSNDARFESAGSNLSQSANALLASTSDRTGLDPQLGGLALNGGTTLSVAPLPGSPAINSGFVADPPAIDQPGYVRVRGGVIDIGPVEFQNDPPFVQCRIPDPYPADCAGSGGTLVTLWADVSDADGDAFTVTWKTVGSGAVLGQKSVPAGTVGAIAVSLQASFPVGETLVRVEVADAYGVSSCSTSVLVVDNIKPVVTKSDIIVPAESTTCSATVNFSVSATDECSGIQSTVFMDSTGTVITSPHVFALGVNVVTFLVTDGSGNTTEGTFAVTVEDTTAPVFTVVPDGLRVPAAALSCDAGVDFTATAADDCSGIRSITYWIQGSQVFPGSTFSVGSYTVTAVAADGAGNVARTSYGFEVIDVTPPTFDKADLAEPFDIEILTDPGYCSAEVAFTATATDNCSGPAPVSYSVRNLDAGWDPIPSTHRFPVGITEVKRTSTDAAGNAVSETFLVTVSDVYLNCLYNVSWPNALPLELDGTEGGNTRSATVQQFLALTDQARWYKFSVEPGSRVTVILSDLPANFDVVVYKDIDAEYKRLFNLFNSTDPETQELALLGVEFAPESFSPESFSPESFSPESFSPESFSPESFSPESFSPESFSPESFSPESFSPESFSPESFSPESFSPESFSPESFSPESFSPESFSPESFSAVFFTPESFSPESFSTAQMTSIIGYSAFPGVANEGVTINTFTRSGDFYVRIKGSNGAFSVAAPFTVNVVAESEICAGLQGRESDWFSPQQPVGQAGGYESLILWDSGRLQGTPEEITALGNKLENALAVRPDVNGKVINLAFEARVQDANDQADLAEFQACPFAKNLVAEEIKAVIDAWWALNPELKYIVLIGNDEDIPFFRTKDQAFLANESNYVPPVIDSTHSQSALRFGMILTQDPYGSSCEVNLVTGPYPYPELAVGRLVESVADISAQIDNYLATSDGVLPVPGSGLVTGYDFLWDVALEVEKEFASALGAAGTVNTLIDDSTVAPADGWSASELANILLGTRHDLVFLAGHFSTGSTLAADYETRLTAAQILQQAPANHFLNSVVYSVGCHSGYNTVDEHAINSITKQPDWAQAFAKMGAILIAGTGYQYGDTEFIEYSERLYLEFTRNLRRGTGPVSIGEALKDAKITYLTETPLMRGIHEKSLLQATLFGLPMAKVNVPGERLEPSTGGLPLALSLTPAESVQGEYYGLQIADQTIVHELSETQVLRMRNIEIADPASPEAFVNTYWYSAKSGYVSNPAEPVRPLEVYKVGRNDTLLRGVGFKGGSYTDISDVGGLPYIPLTGAPTTEIRGVYGNFFSEVYYPIQPFSTNYFGSLCGGANDETRLNVYPTQYLATGGVLGGTLRKYDSMDFRFYYSDNRGQTLTLSTGDVIAPALAPAPSIAKVRSEDLVTAVKFEVNVLGLPAVGIHEVWITYTGIPGSMLHGQWQSLSLSQNTTDSTLWSASLALPEGAVAGDMLFMVQAASATGLVALSTNFGQYFQVGIDELAVREATSLELSSMPTFGSYGEVLDLQATLKDANGNPLTSDSGFRVGFRVGTSKVSGFTDPATGIVSVKLPLNARPGETTLQVYFQGDRTYAPTATGSDFVLTKRGTLLQYKLPLPDEVLGSDIVVSLTDNAASGVKTPLKERTVFFLVEFAPESGIAPVGNAVITDFSGRADLSELNLPPGNATVTAFFNGEIRLPDGTSVRINDDLYFPAEPVSLNVTFKEPIDENSLGFDPKQVDVFYKSSGSKGKNSTPPVYKSASVGGDLAFNILVQPEDILGNDPDPAFVEARVEATLAGEVVASQVVMLSTRGSNGNHWTTASMPGSEVSYVGIHWSDAPRFDSSLSNSPGPRIYTSFIGNNFSEVHFVPVAGTYTTTFPNGIVIAVKNGAVQLDSSIGLIDGDLSYDGNALVFGMKSGILPGQSFATTFATGPVQPPIVVTVEEGINYLTEGGRMMIRLDAITSTPRPASDAEPNLFELRFTLGNEGQTQVRSWVRIGDAEDALLWSKEDPGHKQFRP